MMSSDKRIRIVAGAPAVSAAQTVGDRAKKSSYVLPAARRAVRSRRSVSKRHARCKATLHCLEVVMKLYRLALVAFLIPWNCFDRLAWSDTIDAPNAACAHTVTAPS